MKPNLWSCLADFSTPASSGLPETSLTYLVDRTSETTREEDVDSNSEDVFKDFKASVAAGKSNANDDSSFYSSSDENSSIEGAGRQSDGWDAGDNSDAKQ